MLFLMPNNSVKALKEDLTQLYTNGLYLIMYTINFVFFSQFFNMCGDNILLLSCCMIKMAVFWNLYIYMHYTYDN